MEECFIRFLGLPTLWAGRSPGLQVEGPCLSYMSHLESEAGQRRADILGEAGKDLVLFNFGYSVTNMKLTTSMVSNKSTG